MSEQAELLPAGEPPVVTLEEQIRAVRREIGKREAFYPGWVAAHRMTQKTSDHEIAAMKAVLRTLESLKENATC